MDELILKKTLKNYLPKIKGDSIRVLDAMCGFWSYGKALLESLKDKYKVSELVGVEQDRAGKDFGELFKPPMKYLTMKVEELEAEPFDLVTTFRPGSEIKKEPYEHLKELLKKGGYLLATTYNEEEMNTLSEIINSISFKTKVENNKADPHGVDHAWVLIARK